MWQTTCFAFCPSCEDVSADSWLLVLIRIVCSKGQGEDMTPSVAAEVTLFSSHG